MKQILSKHTYFISELNKHQQEMQEIDHQNFSHHMPAEIIKVWLEGCSPNHTSYLE